MDIKLISLKMSIILKLGIILNKQKMIYIWKLSKLLWTSCHHY